jgi:hypothetical protein
VQLSVEADTGMMAVGEEEDRTKHHMPNIQCFVILVSSFYHFGKQVKKRG